LAGLDPSSIFGTDSKTYECGKLQELYYRNEQF